MIPPSAIVWFHATLSMGHKDGECHGHCRGISPAGVVLPLWVFDKDFPKTASALRNPANEPNILVTTSTDRPRRQLWLILFLAMGLAYLLGLTSCPP
jgi:hypothetical protein